VTYSNPVPTAAKDDNDLATASPTETIHDPEKVRTDAQIGNPSKNLEKVQQTDAPLSQSEEPSVLSTAVYTNPSEKETKAFTLKTM
jgi:hypothetical protein